jgi:uncharacterized protein (DUF58 family)
VDARVKELLKPEVLNTVNGLELIARTIVEGFMSGSNRSQSIGAGQEFSQYKNYQAGDDLRQLDWKMFARSERYYIKEADIETNITVKFILDASHSMAYVEGISKMQYAKVLTAALAYLARKQSDSFGLFTINDKNVGVLLPRFEQQQFIRFLSELVRLESKGRWSQREETNRLFDRQGKEMIVFISDLYDESDDLFKFLSRLKNSRNEIIVFHLMGSKETDFDFGGSFTFEDLETGARTKANTLYQQKEYAGRIKNWLTDTRAWMLEKQINYQLISIDEPIERVLRDFLTARKKLTR